MNSKNEPDGKDLRLAYFQGSSAVNPTDIKAMVRYLSTQYPNHKPANQRGGKKGDRKKGDESKSKDKYSITGNTVGAHVEDTKTTKEFTPSNRTPSIGVHVSETNV